MSAEVTTQEEFSTNSEYYDIYDEYDEEMVDCPACRGTGMDRDEWDVCPVCLGECEIFSGLDY